MKDITKESLNDLIIEGDFDLSRLVNTVGVNLFEADNVDDLLFNYDGVSKGQYERPNISNDAFFDLLSSSLDPVDLNNYVLFLKEFNSYFGSADFKVESFAVSSLLRNCAPEGCTVLPPNIVSLPDAYLSSVKPGTDSFEGFLATIIEDLPRFEADVYVVSDSSSQHCIPAIGVKKDLVGSKLFNPPTMYDFMLQDVCKDSALPGIPYQVHVQPLACTSVVGEKNCTQKPLLRIVSFIE
jgi:hypothetical protein